MLHDSIQEILEESMNLTVLTYSNKEKDHKNLLTSIENLILLIEKERVELSNNSNW